MIIRFIAPSGSPRQALQYVLAAKDEQGRAREVTLIAGSARGFLAAAGELAFKQAYSSCVLGWAPGEWPDLEELDQVLDRLIVTMGTGLAPERLAYVAVRHDCNDRTDVHVLLACVDLASGKHHNAAPPGWLGLYKLLRDWANTRFNWSSPTYQPRQRWIQPARQRYLRRQAETPTVKHTVVELVDSWIKTQVVNGRDDLVRKLNELPGLRVISTSNGRLNLIYAPVKTVEQTEDQSPSTALDRCAVRSPVRFVLSGRALLDSARLDFTPAWHPESHHGQPEQADEEDDQEAKRRRRRQTADEALLQLEHELERRARLLARRHAAPGIHLGQWPFQSEFSNVRRNFLMEKINESTAREQALGETVARTARSLSAAITAGLGASLERIDRAIDRIGSKIGKLHEGAHYLAQRVSDRRRAGAANARTYLQNALGGARAEDLPSTTDAEPAATPGTHRIGRP